MKKLALLLALPLLLIGGVSLKNKTSNTENEVVAMETTDVVEEAPEAVKKPAMLNRSGNETFLSEAYPTGTTNDFSETYAITKPGVEYKVCHYWDVVQNYTFNYGLFEAPFYDINQLERDGYTVIGVKVKYKARATKSNTKLRTKVMIGGVDLTPGDYIAIPTGQTPIEIHDYTYYSRSLCDIKYVDGGSIVITIETNSGSVFTEKVAYISDFRVEYLCKKPDVIGQGTYVNPYMIYNRYQLKAIENEMDAYYKFANDINFKDAESWEPIKGVFNGGLSGGQYEILNFNINELYTSGNIINVGLFETIGSGVVQNVDFRDSQIYVMVYNINPTIYAGFVAGKQISGSIVSCDVNNSYISVASPISYTGSIVGYSSGEIAYCRMAHSGAYGKNILGGIVGMIQEGIMIYCTTSNCWIELEAGANSNLIYAAGGIAGYILNCTNVNKLDLVNVDYVIHGENVCNPAAGYIVGFLNNSNLTNLYGRSLTHNTFSSPYFFAYGNGAVGRTEGSCFVQF